MSKDTKICKYCLAEIPKDAVICPTCGSELVYDKEEIHYGRPTTLSEVRGQVEATIGNQSCIKYVVDKNTREADVLGIYQTASGYTVYENDSFGNHTILYQGTDESEAVKIYVEQEKAPIFIESKDKPKTVYTLVKSEEGYTFTDATEDYNRQREEFKVQKKIENRNFTIFLIAFVLLTLIPFIVVWRTESQLKDEIQAPIQVQNNLENTISQGYFTSDGKLYYRSILQVKNRSHTGWYVYDDEKDSWHYTTEVAHKDYSIKGEWDSISKYPPDDFTGTVFTDTLLVKDINLRIRQEVEITQFNGEKTGYYTYNENLYYYNEYFVEWYKYNKETESWERSDYLETEIEMDFMDKKIEEIYHSGEDYDRYEAAHMERKLESEKQSILIDLPNTQQTELPEGFKDIQPAPESEVYKEDFENRVAERISYYN